MDINVCVYRTCAPVQYWTLFTLIRNQKELVIVEFITKLINIACN